MRHRILVLAVTVVTFVAMLGGIAVGAIKGYVTAPIEDDRYVILVMGSDAGPFRGGSAVAGRADGMQLVTILPKEKRVTILSFARDSWVPVPGYGNTKINAALTRGPETAVRTIENLTGMKVDDWVVTSFRGLKRGVDKLGGLKINVEERLYDPRGARSDLQPGKQELTGKQALAYARDRKSRSGGDFGRSEGHARILKALHRQLRHGGDLSLGHAVRYARLFEQHTESTLTTAELFRLGRLLAEVKPKHVDRQLVDSTVGSVGAASVVFITDRGHAQIADVREDGVLGELKD